MSPEHHPTIAAESHAANCASASTLPRKTPRQERLHGLPAPQDPILATLHAGLDSLDRLEASLARLQDIHRRMDEVGS